MSNSINLFTQLRAKYKVIAEKYHTTRRVTFLVMSEAILASITIFDDAQADIFETDNHGRLFLIEGTRNLCISGESLKRLQFKPEGSLTFATD
jgi:hypothetical protein